MKVTRGRGAKAATGTSNDNIPSYNPSGTFQRHSSPLRDQRMNRDEGERIRKCQYSLAMDNRISLFRVAVFPSRPTENEDPMGPALVGERRALLRCRVPAQILVRTLTRNFLIKCDPFPGLCSWHFLPWFSQNR